MKKIYKIKTLAVAAFALMANVAFGQTLKLTANGEPLANGAVIDQLCEIEDYSQPDMDMYFYIYSWNPHITASTTSGEADMTVTVTSVEDTSGFQICWPMSCNQVLPGQSAVAYGKITSEPVDLQIDKMVQVYEAPSGIPSGGTIKVLFECEEDVVEITINAIQADAAVGENIADSNATPEYYNIQGVRVAEPQKGQLVIERKGSNVTKRIF